MKGITLSYEDGMTVCSDESGNVAVGVDLAIPPPKSFYKISDHRFDRDAILGHVTSSKIVDQGLNVEMKFNSEAFSSENLNKIFDALALPIVTKNDARRSLGLKELAKEDIFPEMHGIKGMKWGVKPLSIIKENNSMTVKLKTPSKNIKRKDLVVGMRLIGLRAQDDLLNAIALVQELQEGERLFRAHELRSETILGKHLRVPGTDVGGICSDAKFSEYDSELVRFVIAGKMEVVEGAIFVVLSDPVDNVTEIDPLATTWSTTHKD